MKIETSIKSSKRNYTEAHRKSNDIKYIVIHGTDHVAPIENFALNLKNNYVGGSAHYFVKDDRILHPITNNNICWSVGNTHGWYMNKNTHCKNSNSINIELCDMNHKGEFSDETIEMAGYLVRELMKRYGISEKNVIRHYDVVSKRCPKAYISESKWKDLKYKLVSNQYRYVSFVTGTYPRSLPNLKARKKDKLPYRKLVIKHSETKYFDDTNKGYIYKKRIKQKFKVMKVIKDTYPRTRRELNARRLRKLEKGMRVKVYYTSGDWAYTEYGYIWKKRLG